VELGADGTGGAVSDGLVVQLCDGDEESHAAGEEYLVGGAYFFECDISHGDVEIGLDEHSAGDASQNVVGFFGWWCGDFAVGDDPDVGGAAFGDSTVSVEDGFVGVLFVGLHSWHDTAEQVQGFDVATGPADVGVEDGGDFDGFGGLLNGWHWPTETEERWSRVGLGDV